MAWRQGRSHEHAVAAIGARRRPGTCHIDGAAGGGCLTSDPGAFRNAIDSLRIANQGSASSEYKCGSCGSLRCTLYHTNSLGAVHLTSVPDMIVQCLDCEHRFTV